MKIGCRLPIPMLLLSQLFTLATASIVGVTYHDNFDFEERYARDECNPLYWHPLHMPENCTKMFEKLIRNKLHDTYPYKSIIDEDRRSITEFKNILNSLNLRSSSGSENESFDSGKPSDDSKHKKQGKLSARRSRVPIAPKGDDDHHHRHHNKYRKNSDDNSIHKNSNHVKNSARRHRVPIARKGDVHHHRYINKYLSDSDDDKRNRNHGRHSACRRNDDNEDDDDDQDEDQRESEESEATYAYSLSQFQFPQRLQPYQKMLNVIRKDVQSLPAYPVVGFLPGIGLATIYRQPVSKKTEKVIKDMAFAYGSATRDAIIDAAQIFMPESNQTSFTEAEINPNCTSKDIIKQITSMNFNENKNVEQIKQLSGNKMDENMANGINSVTDKNKYLTKKIVNGDTVTFIQMRDYSNSNIN